MKKSHVILDHQLMMRSIVTELIMFIILIGGIMAFTLLNNELIESEKSPSSKGTKYVLKSGSNCSFCDLAHRCGHDIPKSALELCAKYSSWIKKENA